MKKLYKKIYIEITNNCNLNCSFCSKDNNIKRNMTLEEFEIILNKISNYTDYIYLHVKGEPLIHKNIIDFLKLAEKYNLKVNLTTNGVLFPKLVNELNTCKSLHKINFSLHSENNINNYVEKILENVDKLNKNIIVIYRLWTLSNNKLDNNQQKIVEKIKKHYNLSTETVDKIKNEKNIKIKSTIYVDKDNKFIWPNLEGNNTYGYCYALKTHIAILVDGTVIPCCLDSKGIIKLGNIYKDNIEDIINSDRYKKLKKSFQDRKPCEELCQKCTFKNI